MRKVEGTCCVQSGVEKAEKGCECALQILDGLSCGRRDKFVISCGTKSNV